MADNSDPESFEEIVEWAYGTLPQKVRDLPDFPGIQVVEEPPADVLRDIDELTRKAHDAVLRHGTAGWFREVRTEHPTVSGRVDRSFDLTRQGFTLLVMGWTGVTWQARP